MECNFMIPDGNFKGFKCPKTATIDNMCEGCHKLNGIYRQNKPMLCLYVQILGEYEGYICQNYANLDSGLCDRCHERVKYAYTISDRIIVPKPIHLSPFGYPSIELPIIGISISQNRILCLFCKPNYHDNLIMYLNKLTFLQIELLVALHIACDISNDRGATTILSFKSFFPETFGYDFLMDPNFSKPSQSVLSSFFYKRFLIKSCILSIESDLIDCIPKILDPFMLNPTHRSYYAIKVSLHILLFPSENIISIDRSLVANNMLVTADLLSAQGHLDVVIYDEVLRLYINPKSGFIIRQLYSGSVKVLGKQYNNKIVPLSKREQSLAISIGLTLHQDAIAKSDINEINFEHYRDDLYLYDDKYILCDYNNRMYFIGKLSCGDICDLDNNDITTLELMI